MIVRSHIDGGKTRYSVMVTDGMDYALAWGWSRSWPRTSPAKSCSPMPTRRIYEQRGADAPGHSRAWSRSRSRRGTRWLECSTCDWAAIWDDTGLNRLVPGDPGVPHTWSW